MPDPKTKVWVDEQNRINTEKTLGYDKSYEEARDTMHPDPQINIEPPAKSQKRGTVVTQNKEKEKDTPQPSHALQEFVKHIADPLVDKGWNLHLKFGKGEPQGEQFIQGSSPWEPTAKTDKKEKSEKQDKIVMGRESEQQIEDEQWEFIRDEVEKMKEARETAQKEQQELKIEQEKIREQKANLEAEEEQRLQAQ